MSWDPPDEAEVAAATAIRTLDLGAVLRTGSRVFGKPRDDSDYDLVVRCDFATVEFIQKALTERPTNPHSVRFGKLNIILCTSDREFMAWHTCTEMCKARGPVSKADAKAIFRRWFAVLGVEDSYRDQCLDDEFHEDIDVTFAEIARPKLGKRAPKPKT